MCLGTNVQTSVFDRCIQCGLRCHDTCMQLWATLACLMPGAVSVFSRSKPVSAGLSRFAPIACHNLLPICSYGARRGKTATYHSGQAQPHSLHALMAACGTRRLVAPPWCGPAVTGVIQENPGGPAYFLGIHPLPVVPFLFEVSLSTEALVHSWPRAGASMRFYPSEPFCTNTVQGQRVDKEQVFVVASLQHTRTFVQNPHSSLQPLPDTSTENFLSVMGYHLAPTFRSLATTCGR